MFEQSEMRAGSALHAFAIENSVVNGGSLTPQKPSRPNQRNPYMGFTSHSSKEQADLIFTWNGILALHKNKTSRKGRK